MTRLFTRSLFSKFFLFSLIFTFSSFLAQAQNRVSGVVRDKGNNETIIGASVQIKGTSIGVTTDIDGKFEMSFKNDFPVTLVVNFLGYKQVEVTATQNGENFALRLEPSEKEIKEVKIIGDRVAAKLKESPVTIERLGLAEIKQTASVGFYEGLSNLKGVDMTSASLGFKIINTRGFNSTSPVRTLQIIDGVDNQAPGLNFSLGNFVGASEIDVEKVDIVVGANSATYGPNAFNGVIDITTKDPYKYEGLNVMIKGASRNLFEGAVRGAHVIKETNRDSAAWKWGADFNNKFLANKLAAKANFSYLTAFDWNAVNYGPTVNSVNGQDAEGSAGYDAVNIYGESAYGSFTKKYPFFELGFDGSGADTNIANYPGYWKQGELDGVKYPELYVYRTGYKESDVTNYNTTSLKLQYGLYYKLSEKLGTLSYNYNYGGGTTVYQGDNRYSIRDIKFTQSRFELNGDRHYLRTYTTREDAGSSYDLVFTAFKLLQNQKSDANWYLDFEDGSKKAINEMGMTDKDQIIRYARTYADSETKRGGAYLQPGTTQFDSALTSIRSNPSFAGGGTKFQDASYMRHVAGMYDFDLTKIKPWLPANFKVGGNYRYFNPNSYGTIFSDTLNVRGDLNSGFTDIHTWEYGVFANTEKSFFNDLVKVVASLRYDDHQNFKPFYTPALSTIWSIRQTGKLRVSYSTAYRNPTLQDQYLLYDIGIAQLKGNLTGYSLLLPQDYYGPNGYINNGGYRPLNVGPVKPEKVRSVEVGYKGIIGNVYVDGSYYYSIYNDFLGYIIGFGTELINGTPQVDPRPTRVSANATSVVTTQGVSVGLNYYFPKYFNFGFNYTYSELLKGKPTDPFTRIYRELRGIRPVEDTKDPLVPYFNTPKNKFNVNFGGRDIHNWGFNLAYKFVQGFEYYGSPQFTGPVRSYGLFDMQVNYTFQKYNTVAKLGSSNVLNNLHFEAYGAPLLGRLVYVSVNYQFNNNK